MNKDFESQKLIELENKISRILITVPNGDMYSAVLEILLDAFNSKYGFFGYINRNNDLICPSMTKNIWAECKVPDKDIVFPHDCWEGLWGQAMKHQKVLYSNLLGKVPDGHIPITNVIAAPIVHFKNLVGCIALANREVDYTDEDVSLMKGITERLAPLLAARLQRDSAVEDLAHSEFQYRKQVQMSQTYLDLAPSIFVALDQNGVITLINRFGAELLECPDKSCIGKNWFEDFIAPEDKENLENVFTSLLSEKESCYMEYENPILTTKGNKRIVFWKNTILKDSNGNIVGTLSAGDDITEQRIAELRLEKYWKDSEEELQEALNHVTLLNSNQKGD